MRHNLIAGVDIGSTKTAAVILEVGGDSPRRPTYKVLGVGQAKSAGVRREIVTDLEETTESVRQAMKEAELMAGTTLDRVYVGVAGDHVHAKVSTGVVAVGRQEIDKNDVQRVHEVARAVVVPTDREVLHALAQSYTVDHQAGIRDPIGMAGTRLEAELFLITASVAATQNRRKAVNRAGYKIEALVHESLANATAVLVEDEKDVGVALVDMGGATTELTLFRDGKVCHLATIPWGAATVTNDLAKGLSITYAEAERTKERFGTASTRLVDPREMVEIPGPGPGSPRPVARELIAHIIEQRLDEILGMVAREMESAGALSELGAGVVLTGGGASLAGATDVAQHVFGLPVRVGVPGDGLVGLADSVRRPKFATATGLALHGAQQGQETGGGFSVAFADGAMGKIVSWLKEFF